MVSPSKRIDRWILTAMFEYLEPMNVWMLSNELYADWSKFEYDAVAMPLTEDCEIWKMCIVLLVAYVWGIDWEYVMARASTMVVVDSFGVVVVWFNPRPTGHRSAPINSQCQALYPPKKQEKRHRRQCSISWTTKSIGCSPPIPFQTTFALSKHSSTTRIGLRRIRK